MVMEYEDEDVFEELVVLANEIQVALKKEEEV
jgi:hypothetical protein